MFEPNTPQAPVQNPLNPVMPAPGMPSVQAPAPAAPQSFAPAQPPVHTMPERFRTTGGGGSSMGGPKGSSTTKKLMITLVIVVAVAGLGVLGLYIFNRTVQSNTNTTANSTNLNTALNLNTNTTTNLNTNTASTNENTNVTLNTNTTVNSDTNTVANTNTSTNTNTTTVSTGPLPSSTDSDSDGLTDTEEAVYGTDVKNSDTDGDTFVDGYQVRADGSVVGELAGLYNPKGAGTLESSSLVKRVENATKAFSLLVPTSWTTNESSGLLVVTPTTQTGEFFQIRMYDKTTGQTLQQWYQANNPQADITKTTTVAVNGLEGIISEDKANVYFAKDSKVYGLTYTASGLSQLNYWTTFTMMMKSFKLVSAS